LSEIAGLEPCYFFDYDQYGNPINVDWDWNANGYRLPTEAEWEAAARDNTDFIYAGSNDPDEVAWYYKDDTIDDEGNEIPADNRIHPVGKKKPNTLGLYDMSGNVWEWCYDAYGPVEDKMEMPDYLPED
jgi:formylglycine-generating enzyme required for sulfatase activity